jgi:hypothetical protein
MVGRRLNHARVAATAGDLVITRAPRDIPKDVH